MGKWNTYYPLAQLVYMCVCVFLLCSPYTIFSFLKQHLGASGPETADVEALKLEVTELRQKVEQLTEENQELKAKACIVTCPYVSVVLYPKML